MKTYDIIDKAKATQIALEDIQKLRLTLNHWSVIHGMHFIDLDIDLSDKQDFLQMYLDNLNASLKEQCSEEE